MISVFNDNKIIQVYYYYYYY